MSNAVSNFVKDENGAVTVDWVVLTAAVMCLNLLFVFTPAREAIMGVMEQMSETLGFAGQQLQDSRTLGDG